MIDLFKYSKKNKFYEFIINKVFKINTSSLTKPFFLQYDIKINLDENFFYDYKNKYPVTKWMKYENAYKFYQSNHNLQKFKEFKEPIKRFEQILNSEVKPKIFNSNEVGKFKIKNIWFTIQQKNEGHHAHNHPKSILSGVFYFKVESNKGGEIDLDLQGEKISHSPIKNQLLIFNSSVFHSVKPYVGNSDRIAVAWDAIYTF